MRKDEKKAEIGSRTESGEIELNIVKFSKLKRMHAAYKKNDHPL